MIIEQTILVIPCLLCAFASKIYSCTRRIQAENGGFNSTGKSLQVMEEKKNGHVYAIRRQPHSHCDCMCIDAVTHQSIPLNL